MKNKGRSNYARIKQFLKVLEMNTLILRSLTIGPDINKDGIGLFNWFYETRRIMMLIFVIQNMPNII